MVKKLEFVKNKLFFIIIIKIILVLIGIGCQSKTEPNIPASKKREIANVLYNQQLYEQAIREYEEYLKYYPLDKREIVNISYMIANIYFDRLHDYENALAFYLRIKYLSPESNLQNEVSKKIVECLERLRRSTEAQQVIEQNAALNEEQKPVSRPGEVVAKIGDREITTSDLQYELNRLPVYMREQLQTKEKRIEFLKNFIVQELLYDSAKRMGLDKEKEVREGVRLAEKSLMAQKLLQEEVEKETGLDKYSNADVELYYKANQEKYAEKDDEGKIKRIPTFGEVQERVAQDFVQEKQQEAYKRLIERLMKAEDVKIYEEKFK